MNKSKIVYPDYNHCVLNLINSIIKHYKVKSKYNGIEILDKELEKNYKNIVFIILDGMGRNLLNQISPNGFFSQNKKDEITSIYPSTTTAVLNTYYSGKPPIETGWIAWSQYFKEYGRAIDMFPAVDSYTGESYKDAKIDVYDLISYETVYDQIEKSSKDVKAYEINPPHCVSHSKRCIKANDIKIMCEDIESLCKNEDRNYIFAYSDYPDKTLHELGCSADEVKEFIQDAEKQIEKLTKKLEGTNTLVIVSADHGHNDIKTTYKATELTEINECLIMPPTLESRAVTFWVKKEMEKEFEKRFNKKFKDEFILLTKEEFLERKFLGEGKEHPKIRDFIGDYMALAVGDSIIKLLTNITEGKPDKKSTHCGLTENEMIVPLIFKGIK